MRTLEKIRWTLTRKIYRFKRKRTIRKMQKRKHKACREADRLTDIYNKRHYVMPDGRSRYLIFNRRQLIAANRQLDPGQRRNFYDIIKEAVYITK
jgi:hypothetical protein